MRVVPDAELLGESLDKVLACILGLPDSGLRLIVAVDHAAHILSGLILEPALRLAHAVSADDVGGR